MKEKINPPAKIGAGFRTLKTKLKNEKKKKAG